MLTYSLHAVKAGARHSASDMEKLNAIASAAKSLGGHASHPLSKAKECDPFHGIATAAKSIYVACKDLGANDGEDVPAKPGTKEPPAVKVAAREDVNPKEGTNKYGDVTFADEKNKKYPLDSESHIRSAWSYVNQEKNASKYSAADLTTIKNKIIAAWKAKIDKA